MRQNAQNWLQIFKIFLGGEPPQTLLEGLAPCGPSLLRHTTGILFNLAYPLNKILDTALPLAAWRKEISGAGLVWRKNHRKKIWRRNPAQKKRTFHTGISMSHLHNRSFRLIFNFMSRSGSLAPQCDHAHLATSFILHLFENINISRFAAIGQFCV